MRLTTARYYTPSGRSIQATGITPDIIVEAATIEKTNNGQRRREADLRGALINPDGDNGPAPADETTAPETSAEDGDGKAVEDYQLSRAIDLLRGIHLFQSRVVN